jgi:hypothetical protein
MPNVMTNPTNFQRRINAYVPGMMYSSDVNYNGATRVSFGAPAVANPTAIVNAVSIAVANTTDLTAAAAAPETYGRNVTYVASGASTATITLNGWDYLGQPVRETIILNGTTPVIGKKAFKSFLNWTNTVTGATTASIGWGATLGLPYRAVRCAYEVANGALAAAGTLIAAVLTDPQTAVTGDPRGTYTPTTAFDGTTIISAVFDFVNDVNTSGNGGLLGIRHFAG